MGNVTAIPEKALPHVSEAEKAEYKAFVEGDANERLEGIRVGEPGFYDPNAGSKYEKNQKPVASTEADDPARTSGTFNKAIARNKNVAVEKTEQVSGRKAK